MGVADAEAAVEEAPPSGIEVDEAAAPDVVAAAVRSAVEDVDESLAIAVAEAAAPELYERTEEAAELEVEESVEPVEPISHAPIKLKTAVFTSEESAA